MTIYARTLRRKSAKRTGHFSNFLTLVSICASIWEGPLEGPLAHLKIDLCCSIQTRGCIAILISLGHVRLLTYGLSVANDPVRLHYFFLRFTHSLALGLRFSSHSPRSAYIPSNACPTRIPQHIQRCDQYALTEIATFKKK